MKAPGQFSLFFLAEVASRQGNALGSANVKWRELWCFEYVAERKIHSIRAEFDICFVRLHYGWRFMLILGYLRKKVYVSMCNLSINTAFALKLGKRYNEKLVPITTSRKLHDADRLSTTRSAFIYEIPEGAVASFKGHRLFCRFVHISSFG